jgi:hypothetical protein
MADIYFGASAPVVAENGNWNDVNQWYSNPGNNDSKAYQPGTLLGRLPLLTDTCYLVQIVTSGVAARVFAITGVNNGVWTGNLRVYVNEGGGGGTGLNDPAATWSGAAVPDIYLNVISGVVNFNFSVPYQVSGGTINGTVTSAISITGGTFNNTVTNVTSLQGGTFNGTVSGAINISAGNPIFNGSLVNISALQLGTGVTFTKAITSWASGNSGSIGLLGGTYNSPSTPTANLGFCNILTGTMAQNIFTPAYTSLSSVTILGGTLSFAGDIQVGAPGRAGTLNINSTFNPYGPRFTGTDKNITVYGSSSSNLINFGSVGIDAGTYTGLLTFLPFTGTAAALYQVRGGTYTPPVQILPLINVAYGTGKGINPTQIYQSYGFATFTQRLSVSGSSDILQSELA